MFVVKVLVHELNEGHNWMNSSSIRFFRYLFICGGRPVHCFEQRRLCNLQLYEDDVCICILDSHPLAPGHSLIIPKRHFSSMEATPPHVIAAMCSKVPFLSNAIMKATDCDAFNLVVNNGEAAGQVIFHTHFHIIPRRSGDKLWPTESFRRSSIEPNETSSLISGIKKQLDSSED